MNSVISSAKDTAEQAASAVKDTTESMRGGLVDLGVQLLRLYNHARAIEVPDANGLLRHVGLQRQSSPLMPIAWFGAGALVGGGVALVLAPTAGKDLRARIVRLLTDIDKKEAAAAPAEKTRGRETGNGEPRKQNQPG